MAVSNPLFFLNKGLQIATDALGINGLVNAVATLITRQVVAIADDSDQSAGVTLVARINPENNALYVSTPELLTFFQSLLSGGALKVTSGSATSRNAALTSVAASVTSESILPANTARVAFSVFNNSSSVMYLAAGSAASISAFSTQIPPQSLFESSIDYQGPYAAVWATATGNAQITEYT